MTLEQARLQIMEMLKAGPMSCSDIGESLWGDGFRQARSYARPAGKALKPLKEEGLVEQYVDERNRWMYRLKGRDEYLRRGVQVPDRRTR